MKTANRSAALCPWSLPLMLLLLLLLVACSFCGIEARTRPCIDDRIVFPRDNDESTTTKVPAWLQTTTVKPPTTASTTTLKDSTEQAMNQTEDSTTIIPIIVNRILVETLPRCKSGFELRANRCRKSA